MTKYNVRFIDGKTKQKYLALRNGNDFDRKLYTYITRAIKDIRQNPSVGIRLHKRLVPKKYIKYGVENILKYDLPKGWRLIYTLANEEIEIYAVIIEWFDHKNYEKRFGYTL